MTVIKVKDNESFEQAMKRFKKTCEKAGVLTALRRREYYDKHSIRKKKNAAAARKRALKNMRRMSRLSTRRNADENSCGAGGTKG